MKSKQINRITIHPNIKLLSMYFPLVKTSNYTEGEHPLWPEENDLYYSIREVCKRYKTEIHIDSLTLFATLLRIQFEFYMDKDADFLPSHRDGLKELLKIIDFSNKVKRKEINLTEIRIIGQTKKDQLKISHKNHLNDILEIIKRHYEASKAYKLLKEEGLDSPLSFDKKINKTPSSIERFRKKIAKQLLRFIYENTNLKKSSGVSNEQANFIYDFLLSLKIIDHIESKPDKYVRFLLKEPK